MAVFMGANFVAMIFLTWMPSYLNRTFHMSLTMAGFSATAYLQIASVIGVLSGGWLADKLVREAPGAAACAHSRSDSSVAFLLSFSPAGPCRFRSWSWRWQGFGFFKGLYDANIWASLHDVVEPGRRATAVGLMNSLGWLAGFTAPPIMAAASQHYGMSACLSANAVIYFVVGCVMVAGIRRFMPARHPQPVGQGH